ncbi:MAG TPA: P1 family peptidase [Solirubrobacterales bacterium]|nr:P1 family peptidase [Solirubrobacterales bacterium]
MKGKRTTARDLGIQIGNLPAGPLDAITDVAGVRVGHASIIRDLDVGDETVAVRTGVTVILPHEGNAWVEGVFAGSHILNGFGELTGLAVVRETGLLRSPIALTNTHSLGLVRDELIRLEASRREPGDPLAALPVVGETWDGCLNDVNGQHVRREQVELAVAEAAPGPVEEGNVGGGTGMVCHGFKGGIGTASRVVESPAGRFTVGALVQANHGVRERLVVAGVPVGEELPGSEVPLPPIAGGVPAGTGSIIVILATDAPVLPYQCDRLAQRAALGVGRTGGLGEHTSGDFMFCFSTANPGVRHLPVVGEAPGVAAVEMLPDNHISPFFQAVVESTEEAIVNALLAAETMTGMNGVTAHALGAERLQRVVAAHGSTGPQVG